jgi:pyridoxal phosphate enzyme (YggS family)
MLNQILDALQPTATRLVAVSKTRPPEDLIQLYEQGQRDFGENKAQELASKYAALPKDIRWHMIGHLQSNKVKYVAPFVHLIHTADSLKILQEIDKQALRHNRIIDCLLQFKIAREDTKYGLELSEADAMLQSADFQGFKNVRIVGVMGMATFTDDDDQIRREFRRLKEIFNIIQAKYFSNQPSFKEISMGMSDDYQIAVEEGSTMVRIGTLLFGPRL